jgi:16S rRNA (uracil1498-N3)-methyltransferase
VAHHAVHVLRLRPGDPVIFFDGKGNEAAGRIVEMRGGKVVAEVGEPYRAARAAGRRIAVVGAIPKGRRASVMVEKLCELGTERFVPVLWARSGRPAAMDRLRRVAAEAARQSGRATVMEIAEPSPAADVAAVLRGYDAALWAHPAARTPVPSALDPDAGSVAVIVGPEGGWTPEEERMLEGTGARRVVLAPAILRVETAAIAAVAAVHAAGAGR